MLFSKFDDGPAVIEPAQSIASVPGMPRACIGVFSTVIAEEWVRKYSAEIIAEFDSVTGNRPIYKMNVDGFTFAFYVPFLGGAAAGASLEEACAMGARHFVYLGCCGVLRHDIADGHLIIPTAALRDEGLSHHYLPPAEEVLLPKAYTNIAKSAMQDLGLPFVEGKTWTTDGFFRETPAKIERAKSAGAICVEMECASLAAVAAFRGVPFTQFLWSADNLDAPQWDKRGLKTKGESVSAKCMTAAIEISKRMDADYI